MRRKGIVVFVPIVLGIIVALTLADSTPKINTENDIMRTGSEITSVCAGRALCVSDEVTQVVDGDTLYTKNYKIRLSLTNTPERNEAGFAEATAFTQSLCPVGSLITIDQDDGQRTDSYGRMVAKVTCSGKNLNSELLENNHGYILDQYCAESEFSSESWAQSFGC